jgi:hypothetical protein
MLGADAIWISFPISSAVTVIMAVAYFRYGNWRAARMITPPTAPPAPPETHHAEALQPSA